MAVTKKADPKALKVDDLLAIMNRNPKLFRALDLEDISEIRK